MRHRLSFGTCLLFAAAALAPSPARAQCETWQAGFALPGPNLPVSAWTSFDDGSGAAVYAAGWFTSIGDEPFAGVARWNGASWSQLGNGLGKTNALVVHDDGTGPALFAGGEFSVSGGAPANTVARWNGTSWQPLAGAGPDGNFDRVDHLLVFDDGGGPALWVSGFFGLPGFPSQHVARWTAAGWSPASSGFGWTHAVRDLAVYDDGGGAALHAAVDTGGVTSGLYRLTPTGWVLAAPAVSGGSTLYGCLEVFDGGGGSELYLGGNFSSVGTVIAHSLARWNGTTWSGVGSGVFLGPGTGYVLDLAVHDDGSGTALYVGGDFDTAGGISASRLARWDGTSWSSSTGTFAAQNIVERPGVFSLASFDDGGGQALFVGGRFARAGGMGVSNAARWRASGWSRLAEGEGISYGAETLCAFDDGSGPALCAGGYFENAGTSGARCIARWNGSSWSAMGIPTGTDSAVLVVGTSPIGGAGTLYAGGGFQTIGGMPANGIAQWSGATWSPLGAGVVGGWVEALATFDDGTGPALYAGGQFTLAGGSAASNIARWDGGSWSALGSGTNAVVRGLAVFDDGTGPALYAAGLFTIAGGSPVAGRIARWNGTSWSAVAGAPTPGGQVFDLVAHDDGNGPALFLSGVQWIGGQSTGLARWDGSTWSPLLPITADTPAAGLFSYDGGGGPRLYLAHSTLPFPSQGPGILAAWDGAQLVTVGTFTGGTARAMAALDDGADGVPDLHLVGVFTHADGLLSNSFARWPGCGTIGTAVCAGDGSAAACPCANFGATGHGCANSVDGQGARLGNSGLASLAHDTLTLQASGMPNSTCIFFQGTGLEAAGAGLPFGDGLLCAGGTLVRLGARGIAAGASSTPPAGALPLSVLGQVPAPGLRHYQVRYRNAASFCTPDTSNFTNALRIAWTP